MANQDNGDGLGAFIKQVWTGLVFLMGIVSAILGYFKLAQGDLSLFTLILLCVGIAGSFLTCLYYAVIWKPEVRNRSRPILASDRDNINQPRKRVRWLARLGLLLIPILVAGLYSGYRYQANLPPKDFLILVAKFETTDAQNHRITQDIFTTLERQMEKYEDIKVEKLDKNVDSIKAAKEIGNQKKAAIVIWGDYQVNKDTVPISVNFEILKKQDNFPELGESVQGETQVAQLAELESFKLQTNLSDELAYLSLFTLGMYSYLEEDWSQAIDYFEQALEEVEQKQNESIASLEKNITYLYLGNSFSSNESYDKALDSYDRAIEINPDDANAWYNRGVALGDLGKYPEAIANFDQAIEINPDDADAWYNRGVALGILGKYPEAIANYDQAIEIQPDYAQAWNNRGLALADSGEYSKAIANYDQAIEINPDYAMAWNNRGLALWYLGEYPEAIANYDQAIKINPDLALAWNNRGLALADSGEYPEAIANFEQAIEINPDYAKAWYNRGLALFYSGEYSKAIANFEQAIEINPDDADAWYNTAISYALQKKIDLALQNLEQAFKLNPDLKEHAKTDPDLDNIRSNQRFQKLITLKNSK